MSEQLSNVSVIVNNDLVAIIPNSFTFTEGLGEQTVRAASAGGAQVEQVYSDNVEMRYSTIKFDLPATIANIAKAREWKQNKNRNLLQMAGKTVDGNITRTFSQASLLSNYEIGVSSDGKLSLEWRSSPAV